MKRFLILLVAVLAAGLVPGRALAQVGDQSGDGFTMRVSGDYHLRPGERIEAVLVIDGTALIDGTVEDALVVINGDAVVRGTVDGDTAIIRGDLTIGPTGVVDDVSLIRSDLIEEPGSTIRGDVDRTNRVFWPGFGILIGAIFYLGFTVVVLVAGVVFAAVGGKQLTLAAASMGERPARTILTGLAVAIGLPIVAVIALITIIGIPVGIGILLFLLPALAFLGYIVAGTWFGMLMLSRGQAPGEGRHPYKEALLGLGVLQAIGLVPGLGAVLFVLLGTWGMGALITLAIGAMRGGGGEPRAAEPAPAPAGGAVPGA